MAETIDVCITVVFHKTVSISIENSENLENINLISEDAVRKDMSYMEDNGWSNDEFEAIKE